MTRQKESDVSDDEPNEILATAAAAKAHEEAGASGAAALQRKGRWQPGKTLSLRHLCRGRRTE